MKVSLGGLAIIATAALATVAHAQQPAGTPAPAPAPTPTTDPAVAPTATEAPTSGLRVHVLTSRNQYVAMSFDVFSADTKQVVASSAGAVESRGETPPILDLKPGTYKIVRAGEPFDTRVDFAIATIVPDTVVDYLIVVDPDSLQFRGSGPVVGELPKGVELLGVRLSLNGGGNLMFTQTKNAVGYTSGETAVFGVFGNFGLVVDRGVHFLDVGAELKLDLVDPVTGSVTPTNDRFAASALYSYKIRNPYIGPYIRAAMKTRIFPGFVYFQSPNNTIRLDITHADGSMENVILGGEANPDDLRYKVANSFAPFQLQEELGANLKAVDLDLVLLKLNVATRIGFGFRQGFTNNLLVVAGEETDEPAVRLFEIDNYSTLGPLIGANAKVTFARWLFGSAQFGLMVPLLNTSQQIELLTGSQVNFGGRLLIDFSGTAGFKVPVLTNLLYASADYTFRLERDAFITDETQFEHALMARANLTLF